MTSLDAWIAKARAVPIEAEIERRGIRLNGGKVERCGPGPICGGDDRFSINTAKGVWNCRGCGKGGDVIDLVAHLDGADFIAACTALTGEPPPPRANGKAKDSSKKVVVASFEYHDQNGNVAFAVDRIEFQKPDGAFVLKDGKHDKVFRQRRPDPDHPDRWINNVTGAPVVPYRLPEVIEAIAAGHPVLIVEGEAKADLLASWNIVATTNPGGSKKWKPQHSEYLRDADVVLVPDHDNAGWEHVNAVGPALVGIAKRTRVLMLPNLPPKGDIIDWTRAGGTREQLDALIAKAQDWKLLTAEETKKEKTKAQAQEDELLAALAQTQGLEFARKRKETAKALGVTGPEIDAELRARREAAPLHGHWIVEPWPDPVDGDSLLRDIIARLRRHVVCSLEDAIAIALWVMLAWAHEGVAIHSPVLNVNSAEPESGKSTTLGLVSFLAPRCVSSVEISEAALYRAIKLWQPSFAIDEFDSVLASDDKAALRSVINSGHTRGQGVIRCIGDDKTPELFSTFSPKAVGMCGKKLPPATLSRCVFVELRRKKAGEKIERFEHKDDPELADLRRRLLRWSMDNEDTLRTAAPTMPEGFDNRRADNWRVMLAISDLCCGAEDWGDKARAAAVKIEGKADSRTAGARLLAAIKAILGQTDNGEDAGSQELIDKLAADPDSEWAEWKNGKPITQAQLARLLKPFHIFPGKISVGGREVRGYRRSQFEDAWATYL